MKSLIQSEPEDFKVGDWQVSPSTLRISQSNSEIKLEPKVMQVLCYLAKHPNLVISRQTLEEEVWVDMVVGYEALTNTIIKLRKAFDDNSKHPSYIETIPKKGYRLIAKVQEADQLVAIVNSATLIQRVLRPNLYLYLFLFALFSAVVFASVWRGRVLNQGETLTLPSVPSIAVMPFLNISNDASQSYFSDGITDDIIIDLSNLSGLFVISRNSVFPYKGKVIDVKSVARILGVQYLLQGSIRREKNTVKIKVQLVDSQNEQTIWGQRFNAKLENLFEVQNEIVRQITSALSVRLTKLDQEKLLSNQTIDLASYDEFLKGWSRYWRFTRKDFAIAETHFKQAIVIDENNARAHAGLALIYWQVWNQKWHNNTGNPHAGWVRAKSALNKAMLKPTSLALSTQSAMLLVNRRYDAAILAAKEAIIINSNKPEGYLALADALGFSGQPGKAIEQAKIGFRLDPNFAAPYLSAIGRSQFDMGLYKQAANTLERANLIHAFDHKSLVVLLASYGQLNELEKAKSTLLNLNTIRKRLQLSPYTIDWIQGRWPYRNKINRDQLVAGLEKAGIQKW